MKHLLTAVVCAITLSLTAQTENECNWGIQEVYVKGGGFNEYSTPHIKSLNEWFPKSKLMQEQGLWENDFQFYGSYGSQSEVGAVIMQAPVKFSSNSTHQLKVGAVFGNNMLFTGGNYNTTALYRDTLRSSRGVEIPFEREFTESVHVEANAKYLGVSVDYNFLFNQDGRWTFYGGVGAMFSATYGITSKVYAWSYESNHVENNDEFSFYSQSNGRDGEETREDVYAINGGSMFGVHLPLGINFRIGKNREFWRHWYLGYELNNQFYQTSNLPDDIFKYRKMHSATIKYRL